jgi:hypothetical protein
MRHIHLHLISAEPDGADGCSVLAKSGDGRARWGAGAAAVVAGPVGTACDGD